MSLFVEGDEGRSRYNHNILGNIGNLFGFDREKNGHSVLQTLTLFVYMLVIPPPPTFVDHFDLGFLGNRFVIGQEGNTMCRLP